MWDKFLIYKSESKKQKQASLAAAIVAGQAMINGGQNAGKAYRDFIENILNGVDF